MRDDGVGSAVLLVGLGVLSLGVVRFEWRKERHLAALTGVLVATWVLSALLAWLGDHTGIF